MMCRQRNFLILFLAAATISPSSVGADVDAPWRHGGENTLAAASASTAPPRAHELDNSYTFEQYLTHFGKSYDKPEEYARRSRIFSKNLNKILAHNSGKMTDNGDILHGGYVMGVNKLTDVEREEMPMGYNKVMHPSWRAQFEEGRAVSKIERLLGDAAASYSKPPEFHMDDVSNLPIEVDWAKEGKVNPIIPNQGVCGSCWSFAATAAIESNLAIVTGEEPTSLSVTSMLLCTPDPDECGGKGNCTGSTVELAFNYVADITAKKKGGMYNIKDVPYSDEIDTMGTCHGVTKGKVPTVGIEGWSQLPTNNYQFTMNAVAKVGPVVVGVDAYNWAFYEKGVFEDSDDATTVDHAVLLVGYGVDENTGEKYYKIRNSWGPDFGENGFIRISRNDDDDKRCNLDNDPLVGLACALDDNGNKIDVQPVKVCGTDGILFDVAYPVGAHYL